MSEVVIVYPGGTVRVPWERENSVKGYLKHKLVREHRLLLRLSKYKLLNKAGVEIQIWYKPTEDDAIVFVPLKETHSNG